MLEMNEKAYFLKCLKLALSATATANSVSFIIDKLQESYLKMLVNSTFSPRDLYDSDMLRVI